MSEQDNGKITAVATPQRPTTDDPKAWKAYWEAQGQPWRTEPEIDIERQRYLAERRNIKPDIEKGIYPFKDIRMNRADVEWLLATHENGQGPVCWSDENQQEREGLDLRGADLSEVDLHGLPLAFLRGSLTREESRRVTIEQSKKAAIILTRANLRDAHLEYAQLILAQLDGTSLVRTCLNNADLARAQLVQANCFLAQLDGVDLRWAHLEQASLVKAQLKGADLKWAHLEGADLSTTTLSDKDSVGPLLADVYWGNTNLAVVDWSQIRLLGDEYRASQDKDDDGKTKDHAWRLHELRIAIRANRQLIAVLQNQGLDESAVRFAYRVRILQRKVMWKQRAFGQWLFSMVLAILAGYGYRTGRSVLSHIPQFRERKNRIVNRRDQADEEPADEEFAAPEPECASVNHCGCARDQCPQNIGKSSASSGGWSVC